MSMSCDSTINACPPCTDDPVLNISSEGPDSDRFVFNIDLLGGGPQLNELFEQLGCFAWCWSEISQEDADLCAIMQAIQCANDAIRQPATGAGGFPIIGGQVPPLLFNTAKFCQFTCPDGAAFGWTFPPNQVAARTLLEANRIAHSYACRYARLRKICIVSTPDSACAGQAYTGRLEASGGTPFTTSQGQCPYLWQIISGSLPTGLSLNQCTGAITGTPTAGGSSVFTVRATDAIGSYQQKVITLNVVEITDVSNLPDATVGEAYSHTLTVAPAGTYFYQFFSGSPPDWLSLNSSTGELSGTPDDTGDFLFGISVESTDGTQCVKEFTLAVISASLPMPTEYWSFNASNTIGDIQGIFLIGLDHAFVAGKDSIGVRLTTSASTGFIGTFPTPNLNFVGDSIVASIWFKEVIKPSDPASAHNLIDLDFSNAGPTVGSLVVRFYQGDILELRVTASDLTIDTVSVPYDPGTSDFHLLVLSYSRVTGLASVRIDNVVVVQSSTPKMVGATTTDTGAFVVKFGPTPADAGSVDVDEWSLWMNDTEFTEGQFATLWNNGTGRFWPF